MKKLYLNTDLIIDRINSRLPKKLSQKAIGQIYGINERTLTKYKRYGMSQNTANLLVFLADAGFLINAQKLLSKTPFKPTDPTERKKELHKKTIK